MKSYNFKSNQYREDFFYAYGPVAKAHKKFIESDGCLCNFHPGEAGYDNIFSYDYISMITKEKYKEGVKFSTLCSFEKYGAPLLVFCDDLKIDTDGSPIYQLHFEIVAYEDGLNIWHIIPWPERKERPIKPTLIGQIKFKIQPNELINISAEIKDKTIYACANGHKISCQNPDIPDQFHIGITACEGHNSFFEFKIQK